MSYIANCQARDTPGLLKWYQCLASLAEWRNPQIHTPKCRGKPIQKSEGCLDWHVQEERFVGMVTVPLIFWTYRYICLLGLPWKFCWALEVQYGAQHKHHRFYILNSVSVSSYQWDQLDRMKQKLSGTGLSAISPKSISLTPHRWESTSWK